MKVVAMVWLLIALISCEWRLALADSVPSSDGESVRGAADAEEPGRGTEPQGELDADVLKKDPNKGGMPTDEGTPVRQDGDAATSRKEDGSAPLRPDAIDTSNENLEKPTGTKASVAELLSGDKSKLTPAEPQKDSPDTTGDRRGENIPMSQTEDPTDSSRGGTEPVREENDDDMDGEFAPNQDELDDEYYIPDDDYLAVDDDALMDYGHPDAPLPFQSLAMQHGRMFLFDMEGGETVDFFDVIFGDKVGEHVVLSAIAFPPEAIMFPEDAEAEDGSGPLDVTVTSSANGNEISEKARYKYTTTFRIQEGQYTILLRNRGPDTIRAMFSWHVGDDDDNPKLRAKRPRAADSQASESREAEDVAAGARPPAAEGNQAGVSQTSSEKRTSARDPTSRMREAAALIHRDLDRILAEQSYYKARLQRHTVTQKSTQWRAQWYTTIETGMLIVVVFFQTILLQRLMRKAVHKVFRWGAPRQADQMV